MADTARPTVAQDTAPRRQRFDGEQVLAMMRAGILAEGGPEELLDGEIWVVASEGPRHSQLKVWLNRKLVKWAPDDITVACDTTIRFADDHWPEPDLALFPASCRVFEARGPDMLLVIEIADSSTSADLVVKGPKYKEYGVREYWVVDVTARLTHVHRLDGPWPSASPIPFDVPIKPALLANIELRMADFEI